jgi:hypothetical protein
VRHLSKAFRPPFIILSLEVDYLTLFPIDFGSIKEELFLVVMLRADKRLILIELVRHVVFNKGLLAMPVTNFAKGCGSRYH